MSLVPSDELRATHEERRPPNPGLEDELVDRLASKVASRLAAERPRITGVQRTIIAVVSLLAAIPLLAIAAVHGGFAGIALVCLALVLVNLFAWRG